MDRIDAYPQYLFIYPHCPQRLMHEQFLLKEIRLQNCNIYALFVK
ncbi:hypothetical protein [Bacillus sp. FSL K6-3431]